MFKIYAIEYMQYRLCEYSLPKKPTVYSIIFPIIRHFALSLNMLAERKQKAVQVIETKKLITSMFTPYFIMKRFYSLPLGQQLDRSDFQSAFM